MVYGHGRRFRSKTALEKLAKLRQRVPRFKKVGQTLQEHFSPNLKKALLFLDDKLLPSTSNAVERSNRRFRTRHNHLLRANAAEMQALGRCGCSRHAAPESPLDLNLLRQQIDSVTVMQCQEWVLYACFFLCS